MPRLGRVVIPGFAHHVTQRGNRRQLTFFYEDDYRLYLKFMSEECNRHGVEVWAYCLMPNHSHLIVVPPSEDALRRAIGEAHRRYTLHINDREGWQGYLWQGRFSSFVMDERHLRAAARYIELNPVRAGLVLRASDHPWSSARAHLGMKDDGLVKVAPLLERIGDWASFLGNEEDEEVQAIRRHQLSGLPLGDDAFVDMIEAVEGRTLRPPRRGRPRKESAALMR